MKRFLFLLLVVVALIMPTTLFASNFMELYVGGGTSQFMNGQYSISDDYGNSATYPLSLGTSSFDFVLGLTDYMPLNNEHNIWWGVGVMASIPVSHTQNEANDGSFAAPVIFSADVPFMFDASPTFSITIKPSVFLVTVWDKPQDTNYIGVGFGIGFGPTVYFSSSRTVGISALMGYERFHSIYDQSLTSYYSSYTLHNSYDNGGWYARILLTILLGNRE
jgi:hypothetical protein